MDLDGKRMPLQDEGRPVVVVREVVVRLLRPKTQVDQRTNHGIGIRHEEVDVVGGAERGRRVEGSDLWTLEHHEWTVDAAPDAREKRLRRQGGDRGGSFVLDQCGWE